MAETDIKTQPQVETETQEEIFVPPTLSEEKIKLTTSDGKELEYSRTLLDKCMMIKNMIEDLPEVTEIPLPNLDSHSLELIMDYAVDCVMNPPRKKEAPKKEAPKKEGDAIEITYEPWEEKFRVWEHKELIDVTMGANYMNFPECLNFGVRCLAAKIKGKTTQQIRDTFGIVNDFTPEEEEANRKEYEWVNDQ